MNFLHIIAYNGHDSYKIVDFIEHNFDKKEYGILLLGWPEIPDRMKKYQTISADKLTARSIAEMKSALKSAERVIWHGLYLSTKWLLWFYMFRSFDSKFVWVAQGTDLYSWQKNTKTGSIMQRIKAKLHNAAGMSLRKRMSYFGALFPRDKYFFERMVNPHGRMFDLSYLDGEWAKLVSDSEQKTPVAPPRTLRIMVGLNGSHLNNHIAILNSLVNLRYEDIKLYIPLGESSWNTREYRQKVFEYARLMYGSKAIIINDFKDTDDYLRWVKLTDMIISRVEDRAVHCHQIYEQALTALAAGKAVYLLEKSKLYEHLAEKKACVRKAETVFSSTVQKLRKEVAEPVENMDYIHRMEALSQDVSLWRKMLFSLSREDKPVKFLHIIRPSQELSTPILEIVENNFNVDEHSFLVNRRIPLQSCEGLMEFSVANLFLIGRTPFQRFRYMYRQMERAEHIIWHGFYVGHRKAIMSTKELILVSLFPKFLKKTAWVGWGLDIYDWETDESKFSGLRKREVRFFNRLSLQARKSVPYFISLFPPDGKRFSEMFGDHARVFDGTYSNLRFAEILESTRPQQPRSGKLVKILVGHSANVWNYHMDILNDLAQYRYENIRIYIPLSTGVDPEYSKKVQQYANQLFGKKAECITEKMPLKDYIRFLWGMDIAIFRLNRQAALGNLMNLLYMGKKVFLPAGTVMYDFFREQGIDIQDSMGIAQMPFSEFAKLPDHREPPAYILDRTDRQKIVEKWRHIFNEIGGSADNGCEKAAEKTTAAK